MFSAINLDFSFSKLDRTSSDSLKRNKKILKLSEDTSWIFSNKFVNINYIYIHTHTHTGCSKSLAIMKYLKNTLQILINICILHTCEGTIKWNQIPIILHPPLLCLFRILNRKSPFFFFYCILGKNRALWSTIYIFFKLTNSVIINKNQRK